MTNDAPAALNHVNVIPAGIASEAAQRARTRIARRVMPYVFLLYVINFLDRMNVGAAALQMPRDLGFSDKVVGLGAGIFFIGYFLLEIPGALIAERWSAKRWIARIMVSWGIATVAMAFIHSTRGFYTVRFLVGAAEAGFFPAVVVYLTHWFRYEDRAKVIAFLYAAYPTSFILGSPLAGWLLGISWLGLRGWRWLFILEGIPAIVLGFVTLFYLTDWPKQAKWLPPDERDWITEELFQETQAKKRVHSFRIWEALRHRDVILLTLCYFFALTGGYGVSFWLPVILKRLSGLTDLKVTLLAALPYIAGLVAQQLNGYHSDRTRERRRHAAAAIFLCGSSLLFAVLFRYHVGLSIAMFSLAGAGYFAFHPAFWPIPTQFLSEGAAAVSIGLINSVGNLGGFVGPMAMGYLVTRTKSFSAGLLYLVGSLFLSAVLMMFVRAGSRIQARPAD